MRSAEILPERKSNDNPPFPNAAYNSVGHVVSINVAARFEQLAL